MKLSTRSPSKAHRRNSIRLQRLPFLLQAQSMKRLFPHRSLSAFTHASVLTLAKTLLHSTFNSSVHRFQTLFQYKTHYARSLSKTKLHPTFRLALAPCPLYTNQLSPILSWFLSLKFPNRP